MSEGSDGEGGGKVSEGEWWRERGRERKRERERWGKGE